MENTRKISILHYISIRFVGIIVVMAIAMCIFISYFSNQAIYLDIRRQLRHNVGYDFSNITIKNGEIIVDDTFSFEEDNVQKIILTKTGEVVSGSYPEEELAHCAVQQRRFQKVKCASGYYYIYDRPIVKRDSVTGKKQEIIIRGIGRASDFDVQYRTLKYIAYLFTLAIVLIGIFLVFVTGHRLTVPMKQILEIRDEMEKDDNPLRQRITYQSKFKEIDAMIQANNRLMAKLEDMFESQKQFTSDVAHELRTPISVVMAECQYVKKYGKTPKDYTEALDTIERQTKKTNQIVGQLLMLSRLDQGRIQGEFEYASLQEIVKAVCENNPLQEQKNITVRQNLEDVCSCINVPLFSVAVKNLVDNALKYSEENSCIDVILCREPAANSSEKGKIVFQVKDYGCGMNQNTLNHIFDRFYRADKARNSDGFGLGLSIVWKIIILHQGQLKVESEEGKGSVFTIYLNENSSLGKTNENNREI